MNNGLRKSIFLCINELYQNVFTESNTMRVVINPAAFRDENFLRVKTIVKILITVALQRNLFRWDIITTALTQVLWSRNSDPWTLTQASIT